MVIACSISFLLFDVTCSEAFDLSTEQERAWAPLWQFRMQNEKYKRFPPPPPKTLSIIIPLRPGSEIFLQWGQKWQKARKSLLGVKTFMQLLGTTVKTNSLYRQLYQDVCTANILGKNLDLNILFLWQKILHLGATFTAHKNLLKILPFIDTNHSSSSIRFFFLW